MSAEPKRQKKWLKTLKILAAYLVAAWTFLQFVDWVLNRYNISPHWVDVLLWLFIGIIPSLAIYLYHQERINKRILKLREKIIIPLNIIILIAVVYFGFGNSDLGATTKDITFENEAGETEVKTITKEEFRIGFPIFSFKQLDVDSTTQWLSYGINKLLYEDLLQNKNISPELQYETSTTDKIREAALFYDFYVDGSYKKNGTDFEITTNIRKASNGKILKKQVFTGPNVLALLDDISVFITMESGFVEDNSLQYLDLPINEFISNSLPALERYTRGDYRKAFDIDKKFALAYLEQAKRSSLFNQGKLETQSIIDKAFALKNKLPLQKQLEVYIQRNIAYDQFEDAEKQVNLQLQVDPKNDFYNRVLFSIYGQTKQTVKDVETSKTLFEKDPSGDTGTNLIRATALTGQDDYILNELKSYELINPYIKTFYISPLLHKGDASSAGNLLNELKIQYPNFKNKIIPFDSAVNYLKSHTTKPMDLEQFVGRYRSNTNEQTLEFWIENERIIKHVNNQRMVACIPAGDHSLVSGFIVESTIKHDAMINDSGDVIGLVVNQYYANATIKNIYWKLDNSITAANEAFEKGNLEDALNLYTIAIENNPENSYLKNLLAHVTYTIDHSSDSILQQKEKHAGTYGPRNFWVENGKFYYKRKGEKSELSKVELLPISETTYMDMTRLNVLMSFEEESDGLLISNGKQFNSKTNQWELLTNDSKTINRFPKDQ